jgi:hypothetical protein
MTRTSRFFVCFFLLLFFSVFSAVSVDFNFSSFLQVFNSSPKHDTIGLCQGRTYYIQYFILSYLSAPCRK